MFIKCLFQISYHRLKGFLLWHHKMAMWFVIVLFEGLDGGVGITANTKILGHLTANSKTFAVTVKKSLKKNQTQQK